MPNKNRRTSARYGFVTTLRYRAFRQINPIASGAGKTIDMSAGGLAVTIGRTLEAGVEIELALDWPGLYHGRPRMRLHVWAEVLRSDPSSTALRILTSEFRNITPARAVA